MTLFRRVGSINRYHVIPPGVHMPGNPDDTASLTRGVPAFHDNNDRYMGFTKGPPDGTQAFLKGYDLFFKHLFIDSILRIEDIFEHCEDYGLNGGSGHGSVHLSRDKNIAGIKSGNIGDIEN